MLTTRGMAMGNRNPVTLYCQKIWRAEVAVWGETSDLFPLTTRAYSMTSSLCYSIRSKGIIRIISAVILFVFGSRNWHEHFLQCFASFLGRRIDKNISSRKLKLWESNVDNERNGYGKSQSSHFILSKDMKSRSGRLVRNLWPFSPNNTSVFYDFFPLLQYSLEGDHSHYLGSDFFRFWVQT